MNMPYPSDTHIKKLVLFSLHMTTRANRRDEFFLLFVSNRFRTNEEEEREREREKNEETFEQIDL